MGFSPLREALNRLQAERLVTSESLRGFRVAPLSLAEFEDALAMRLMIETEALRAAIRPGGDDWAASIVSTLYALKLQADRKQQRPTELEQRHHAFHRALLAACDSPWMLEFFERLYTANERYRIPALLASDGRGDRDIMAEHSALAEAVLARDTEKALALLVAHYQRTAEVIRGKMAAKEKHGA